MENTTQRIDAFLQANLDDYIAETARLCAQPSVSAKAEGIEECADLVAKLLEQRDFCVQKFATPGNPVIVAHAEGQSERTLLFYNHYDVQPPEPLELWTSPPFEPTVRNGALYARGAADDKGEFIARLAAVEAVRAAHNGMLPCGVAFVVDGEEEIGSPNIAQFVQEHLNLLKCQGAIWEAGGIDPDGHPMLLLGVRGILYIELSVKTMKRDEHSGKAHILPNAAWRLLRALDSLKAPDERVRIPGFYDQVKPPSEIDIELLDALPDYEQFMRTKLGVREFVRGRTGKDLNRAVFEPTCNIDSITAGYQGEGPKTVIPAEATAKVDFRLVPNQDPDDVFAKVRAHLDDQGFTDVRVTRLGGAMWPAKTSSDDPLVKLTARTGEQVYSQPSLISPLIGPSSPIYAFADPLGGIPVVTAGVGYSDNCGHAPNEHVRIKDFHNGARHIARILDGFAGLSYDTE
jgi:acetylornithine deacetylase/succinyl-diaminopimelate desuccinylase-like protein